MLFDLPKTPKPRIIRKSSNQKTVQSLRAAALLHLLPPLAGPSCDALVVEEWWPAYHDSKLLKRLCEFLETEVSLDLVLLLLLQVHALDLVEDLAQLRLSHDADHLEDALIARLHAHLPQQALEQLEVKLKVRFLWDTCLGLIGFDRVDEGLVRNDVVIESREVARGVLHQLSRGWSHGVGTG